MYICFPSLFPSLQMVSYGEDMSEFLLSGHTAAQLQTIERLSSSIPDTCSLVLYVEGPHRIWINKSPVQYFSLWLAAKGSRHITNKDEGELFMHI